MALPDKFHRDLDKLIKQQNPQSNEELQAFLNTFMGKSISEISVEATTDEEKALDLIENAYNFPAAKARKQGEKALKLDPNCIEACEFIANTYSYYDKMIPWLEKGIEIGRKKFGGAFLEQHKGHFYNITETRPFIRCLSQLAECWHFLGPTAKSIPYLEEILSLNSSDNMGVRYRILPWLIEINDMPKFEKYWKKHGENEDSVMMYFNHALYLFKTEGPSDSANQVLKTAMANNKFVATHLLKQYPPQAVPDAYTWHSEEEALIYVLDSWRAWLWTAGAKDWFRQIALTTN